MMKEVFITAEVGINHNGDLNLAKRMIDAALLAGCAAVKFQKRTIETVYTKEFLDSPRQSPWGTTQRDQKNGLEFGEAQYDEIDRYCKELGIGWFASAWDVNSQKFLRRYDLKYNKVASPVLTNIPLLKTVAEEKHYTFIATGMSTWEEIDTAVGIFRDAGCPFELLHCVSIYPMLPGEANLLMIPELKRRYQCPVGYSSHELGNIATLGAVALGAESVERHITLDRKMYGSDQSSSVEPAELIEYVKAIRDMEAARGTGLRNLTEKEMLIRKKMRG
ncbi:MAG: N,N'-diacetyllegionaminic acid synthase [Lentisphaerae bacterium ADurb.Bin242]|nr:MAG: N,N'-diacetyllegionaminic acid synthase [Lentisphaerae bacterium ADurb.Bin242]